MDYKPLTVLDSKTFGWKKRNKVKLTQYLTEVSEPKILVKSFKPSLFH